MGQVPTVSREEQDWIDSQLFDDEDHEEEISDEEAAAENCGRWINGRLSRHCTKAGSEECDWDCPYSR